MQAKYFLIYIPMAAALFVQSASAASQGTTITHSHYAGVYRSQPHDGGKLGPSMNVSLGQDGTATVTEDAGVGEKTLFGHWMDTGNEVRVVFDAGAERQAEPPMVLQLNREGLQAVTWNHASWGKLEPPPMKKGFKVKTSYWLTTTR